VAKTRQLGLVE